MEAQRSICRRHRKRSSYGRSTPGSRAANRACRRLACVGQFGGQQAEPCSPANPIPEAMMPVDFRKPRRFRSVLMEMLSKKGGQRGEGKFRNVAHFTHGYAERKRPGRCLPSFGLVMAHLMADGGPELTLVLPGTKMGFTSPTATLSPSGIRPKQ